MSTVKDFLFKYKIIIGVVVFLLLSFGIYMFVSADEFADKIEVDSSSVTITDGTPNSDGKFDANDEPGNDSSDANNIVRNFDSIKYNVSYKLKYKEGNTGDLQISRSVMVDFLLPTSINAEVSEGNTTTPIPASEIKSVNIDGTDYNYYIFNSTATLVDESKININVSNINMDNGSTIKPIIRVRESTDSKTKDFTEDTDTSKAISDVSTVTVSAKVNYAAKLYSGNTIKSGNKTTLPVGIVIYLPNDPNRGIKGIEVPKSASFSVSVTKTPDNSSTLGNASADNYNENENKYIFNNDFPYSYEKDNNGEETNGNAEDIVKQDNTYILSYDNLKYHNGVVNFGEESNNQELNYISSKVFAIDTTRVENNKDKITYNISINSNDATTIQAESSTTIIDSIDPVVGDYLSKVDFRSTSTSENDTPGQVSYNYGDDFYIVNTMTYGYNSGDALTKGFTNYLKIDSDAIKLSGMDAGDYQISGPVDSDDYVVSFGVGSWKPANFELISDNSRKTKCPTDLTKLSKDELMNYYGGPCIKEKTGQIKWFQTLAEAESASTNGNSIIAVRVEEESEYPAGSTTTLYLKARIKTDSTNIIGNFYQVVARGETIAVDQATGNNKKFYMSESDTSGVPPVNVSEKEQDLNYIKPEGIKIDSPSGKYGNSILVTSAQASANITVTDKNNASKLEVSAGVNDPIKIVVHPTISKPNVVSSTIEDATVTLTLPNTLSLDVQNGDTVCEASDTTTIGGATATNYTCKYTKDDIYSDKNSTPGTIPNIVVHAYVSVDVESSEEAIIMASITGNVKIGESILPISKTGGNQVYIQLFNSKMVGINGSVSPNLINKNGSYTYNMKVKNVYKDNLDLSLLNILPYKGDGVAGEDGSDFSGSLSYTLSEALPQGYTAYYTTSDPKIILANELNNTGTVKWVKWDDVTKAVANMTAFKIDSTNKINTGTYFGKDDGITLNIQTKNNKESNIYYNNFYAVDKTESTNKVYSSNVSEVSVYNRTISGLVFEDSDYNGLSTDESGFKDIVVTLYKTNANVTDYKNPKAVISDSDEKIETTTTDKDGLYEFTGLSVGNYYVKFGFDCEKYTVTEKNKENASLGDLSDVDSDAEMISDTCNPNTENAVSNIVKISNTNFKEENLDLGLRLRQVFDVKVNKYITNVTVTSTKGTESHDYNYKKQVRLDFRNLKNTSFKVTYVIEIENTKYFPGTVGNIIETIPEGMTFDSSLAENSGWYENDGNLYYSDLSSTLLMPGEKYRIPIVFNLSTDSGGYYVNFVAVNDLQIQPLVSDFTEVPDDSSMNEVQPTDDEMEGEE